MEVIDLLFIFFQLQEKEWKQYHNENIGRIILYQRENYKS